MADQTGVEYAVVEVGDEKDANWEEVDCLTCAKALLEAGKLDGLQWHIIERTVTYSSWRELSPDPEKVPCDRCGSRDHFTCRR